MQTVTVEQFISNRMKYRPIDVRSPAEYDRAHIPCAVNVPLLTDEERTIIGDIYRRQGAEKAKMAGLETVACRLPQMVEKILAASGEREPLIYCWRGGLRSHSMCSVFSALKYSASQLSGGYRAFRRFIYGFHKQAVLKMPVYVLNGLTGVGKTRLLRILQRRGYPALDLEGMANNRGSVFGAAGLGKPRSQKDFEALLAMALLANKNAPYLVVEGEGRRIGHVLLPDYLFRAMSEGRHILLVADLAVRVERIVEEYGRQAEGGEELAEAVMALQKRLGTAKCRELAAKIRQGAYHEAALELCCSYYDKYYQDSRGGKENYLAVISANDLEECADNVIAVIKNSLHSENLPQAK